MSKHRSIAPSQRQLRVGEELRRVLAEVLERGDVNDPRVEGIPITVTEVRASPDLKNATAYVLPLGGSSRVATDLIAGLNQAMPFLRHRVAEKIRLRYAPKLTFSVDTTFDEAERINVLLKSANRGRDHGA